MTSPADGGVIDPSRPVVAGPRPSRYRIQGRIERAANAVGSVTGPPEPAWVVLGNQKAGTSAVAAAVGEAVGGRYQIDLPIERYDPTHRRLSATDPAYPARVVRRSAWRLGRPVVKEPSLTFWWSELAERWPSARLLFVVRHPLDNVRSVLDRLGLLAPAGDHGEPAVIAYPWFDLIRSVDAATPARDPVETVETLGDVVGALARRWRRCAEAAIEAAGAGHAVLRYEDFVDDPTATLAALGLPPVAPSILRRSYQPAGRHRAADPASILAPCLPQLSAEVAPVLERVGYSAERKPTPIRRSLESTNPLDLTTGSTRGTAVSPRSAGKGSWT